MEGMMDTLNIYHKNIKEVIYARDKYFGEKNYYKRNKILTSSLTILINLLLFYKIIFKKLYKIINN